MKVLITAGNGFLGKKIVTIFKTSGHDIKSFQKSEFDITNTKKVEKIFKQVKPEILIHNAALTNVDYCELNPVECNKINITGTKNVLNECKKYKTKIIYISTDYVFDGTKKTPYTEEDTPNPINVYGKSKYEAEKLTIKSGLEHVILRPTILYGYNDNNDKSHFMKWVIESLKNGQEIKIVDDQFGNPTLIDDIANAINLLIEKNKTGIYNSTGPECLSRYEFATKITNIFNLNEKLIKPTKTEEIKQNAIRPKNLQISIDKLKKNKIEMHSVINGLKTTKQQM